MSYSYDAQGRRVSMTDSDGYVTGYTYNADGFISTKTDEKGTWRYSYDGLGQLVRAEAPDGTVTAYTYDSMGNRTSKTVNGQTVRYTANSMGQYTSCGDTMRTYDANGNLLTETRNGQTAAYTWNVWGELIRFKDFDGTVYEYGYDAFGLRNRVTVNGVTTTFLNDPLGDGYAAASYGPDGETHYVLIGSVAAMRTGGETYYYNTDYLGSVLELTGDGGKVVNRYTYDQEGNVLTCFEGVANPYTYAGRYGLVVDGNGLIYDRARYVSTETDSFISMDPAGQNYDLNLYRYVKNNSVNMIDISGERGLSPVQAILSTYYLLNDLYNRNPYNPNGQSKEIEPHWVEPEDDDDNNKGDGDGNDQGDGGGGTTHVDFFACVAPDWKAVLIVLGVIAVVAVVAASLPADAVVGFFASIGTALVNIGRLLIPLVMSVAPAIAADHDPHRTPDRPKNMIEDPSGYVYEGIPSNRLEGVTTTIYFSASETKPTGSAAESQRWNAAAFGQSNPLGTDASGQYMWMVPDGWWQVKYEKAGYDTVWSDWLPVPPVQTEVNVSLTSSAPAKLTFSGDADSGAAILRFSRPVRLDSVNSATVRLTRNGAALSGELIPVDAGIADDNRICATAFELVPEGQPVRSGDALTASFSGVVTYAGTTSSGSASATGVREMPFDDVRASDYFYDPVLWAAQWRIATGTGEDAFSPDQICTRGQIVTFLYRDMK